MASTTSFRGGTTASRLGGFFRSTSRSGRRRLSATCRSSTGHRATISCPTRTTISATSTTTQTRGRLSRRRKRPTRKSQHRAVLNAHRQYYDGLLAYQGGGCAICGKPPGARRHALDHDHHTMQLRGILCTACNMRLTDRHSVDWLLKAADYLKYPPFDSYRRENP